MIARGKKYIVAGAAALFLCVVFAAIFSRQIAVGAVRVGDSFFGGHFYNLSAADLSYTLALRINPSVSDAWHQRARIAFLRGDFDEAMFKINKQFEMRGDERMASYYIRGLIEGYNKDYVAAERDFRMFLTWDQKNWAANNDLAWVYFAGGKFADAKRQTEEAMKSNPKNPWLLTTHAMAKYNQGEMNGVYEELLEAKQYAEKLSEEDWNFAYPGNDPASASRGLASFRAAIQSNLELVHKTQ